MIHNFSATEDVIYVDKPLGWSSFDVIKYLKRACRLPKLGHAGTLDPLATGLLIVCVGKACKRVSFFQALEKKYEGLLRLGERRPSHDLETECIDQQETDPSLEAHLEEVFTRYRGTIAQRPPIFSAIKIKGQRAYQYARHGQVPDLKPRDVQIHSLEALRVDIPWISFQVSCSKGTYIRSLVRDIGEDLGVGAALHSLRRLSIGEIHLDQALSLRNLKENQTQQISPCL